MTSFSELKVRFSRKPQDQFAPIFFSGFRRKHLFLQPALISKAHGL